MGLIQTVTQAFSRRMGGTPAFLIRAPGRVNLIGEHTDYNDGFVLPMAIDRAIWIAGKPRPDLWVKLYSLEFDQEITFYLDQLESCQLAWAEYVKGTAWALQDEGYELKGWDGVVAGDVPIGAGLSSSAALEMASLRAFSTVCRWEWNPLRMAQIGLKAEIQWMKLNCGIMDQLVSAEARAGHALFLDCRSLEYEHIPMPAGLSVMILDTNTRRTLMDSAYNERREQCETAARSMGVPKLRDVSLDLYNARTEQLDPLIRRRARHVITENARVIRAAEALRCGDSEAVGMLLKDSHESLRDDFEVSSEALNQIVASACQHPACLGARMTGAGFSGCAVALVQESKEQDFISWVTKDYLQKSGKSSKVYKCMASEGVKVISTA